MPREAMQALLLVRRHAVGEGRRLLIAALDAAAAAADAVRAAELAIAEETERASEPCGDDHLVEAFAAWLPGARRRAAQAASFQDRQEAEVARCRADLAGSRAALESIEQLCAERRGREAEKAARQDARSLDETAALAKPVDG